MTVHCGVLTMAWLLLSDRILRYIQSDKLKLVGPDT
jgi:hypothetical protein